jgi:hypothetical protein
MRSASTASRVALAGLGLALIGVATWCLPFVFRSAEVITATPSPGPTYSRHDLVLRPGSEACVGNVPIDPATGRVQFKVSAQPPSEARLVIEARAPGYTESVRVTQPAGSQVEPATAGIASPERTVVGEVCARNQGDAPVALYGTNQAPSIGLSQTSLDGRSLGQVQGVWLTLLEAQDRAPVERLGTIFQRAADFTGRLMPAWLAWPLVVLFVLGTPFAVFAAFWLALRGDPL